MPSDKTPWGWIIGGIVLFLAIAGGTVAVVTKPRSIRDKNPFSLEYDPNNPINWEGLANPPSDAEYDSHGNNPLCVFTSFYYGIRAGVINLVHLINGKNGAPLPTCNQLFAVYAPAQNGNDPGQYAQDVANHLGIGPDDTIDLETQLPALCAAIVKEETGWDLSGLESSSVINGAIQAGATYAGQATA